MDLLSLSLLFVCGLTAGAASGLFGIGGGSLYVPFLYWVFASLGGFSNELAYKSAVIHSLILVFITASISARLHLKRGSLDFQSIKIWSLPLAFGVVVIAMLFSLLPAMLLAVALLCVLAFSALSLLLPQLLHFLQERSRVLAQSTGIGAWLMNRLLPLMIGAISAAAGTGAGSLGVPSLQIARSLSAKQATATAAVFSALVGGIASAGVLIGAFAQGFAEPSKARNANLLFDISFVNIYPVIVLTVIIGSFLSAPFGVFLHGKLNNTTLNKAFAFLIVIVAIDLIRRVL